MATFRQVVRETVQEAGMSDSEFAERALAADAEVGFDKHIDRELTPMQEAQTRANILRLMAENATPEGRARIHQAALKFQRERQVKQVNN